MAKYKIIPSSRTIVQSPISIGHKAEKGVEAIEFDLTAWVETYGSGTATIVMKRWGDSIPYPIALEIDENNKATWTLSDTDTAKAGMAYAQLSYIVGDEVVKKSDIYTFRVMDSLTGEGEPPEAYESWLEHLTHLAAEAMAEVLDIEGIVTDKTLTVDGGIADGKATGDALALKADKSTTYTKAEVNQMIEDVEVETDTTLSVSGAPADAKATGDALSALEDVVTEETDKLKADLDSLDESLEDVSADVGEGKTAYTQVMQDETEEEWDVETDTECTKDSEIFTESRNGYINSNGIISGGDKTQHKSFSFQTAVDCKIYVTHTKTYYIGIYNDEPYKSANLTHRTGSTYQNNPTAESPLSISAGQYIVVSMYNDTTLAFGFTLHYITTQSGQVTTPTVIGALKTRTLALETASEAMQDDIDDLKTVKMPWEYAIDHVLCIGDSLTFGSPADSSTMPYPISQNYPYYLGRMLGLSGDVTNGGVPNYGAKTYYHSKFGDFTLTDYNTFIIFLGTNSGLTDTLDTDVDPYEDSADFADTDTGCYCKMIREIYDAVPNAIIILVNTWHIAVVQPDTRTTIDKIGTKYGLPVVATYGVMRYGVNPVYHGGVDNVHCSKAGYLALANLIKDKLYEYFSADISRVNKGMS